MLKTFAFVIIVLAMAAPNLIVCCLASVAVGHAILHARRKMRWPNEQ